MTSTIDLADGVYFGLAEEVYHALPRLSVSGMQKLLVSPATFWASSYLNPKKAANLAAAALASGSSHAQAVVGALLELHPNMPEPEADDAEEVTKAQLLGKAYHCARLEPDQLDARFVRALDKSDMPAGSLFTGTDMGKELEARELKKSGSVAEQTARLIEAGYDRAKLWHAQLADWEQARGERTPIPAEYWEEILADMELIRSTPEVATLLQDGAAEVSILWTDASGIRMKARIDYLRAIGFTDFKSFSNPRGKHVEECIADAFAWNGYHVQAAGYRDAFGAIGGDLPVHGNDEQRALVNAIRERVDPPEVWYVFQETGGVPNLLAKRARFYEVSAAVEGEVQAFSRTEAHAERVRQLNEQKSLWLTRAEREIRKAKRLYRAYSEVYEPGDPWRMFNPIGELTDLSFKTFWLDADIGE